MGIVNDRGRYYWVKRIPKRYAGLVRGADGQPVSQVRQALHTDSKPEAKSKAAQIEAERMAEWEAMLAGDNASARAHYEAARELAQARGFKYRPVADVAGGDLTDILSRLTSLAEGEKLVASPTATAAVLGTVPVALPSLIELRNEYFERTKTRHLKKSEMQRKKWRQKRERAVRNFLDVVVPGKNPEIKDMPLADVNRANALKFRDWWQIKVEGGLKIDTANKDLSHLSEMLRTWAKLTDTALDDPFAGLRLEGKDESDKPAFSREWITGKVLAPGALDGLNDEAADVLLIMLNTALRPSEITDAPLSDFETTANIPYLRVAPNGRELKVAHTKRDVPLLGVSLEAARRIVARGGILRYRHKAGSWSAAVNKYLATNGLRESPAHTAYSIRHYVENALLAAKVDDRVRADILGHKYHRPSYGDGGALAGRAEALALIAL